VARVSDTRVSAGLWIAAFLLTVVLAVFQRMTGPSYPARGSTTLSGGETIRYRLPRSNQGRPDLRVAIPRPAEGGRAVLEWRRYPTGEAFRRLAMVGTDEGRLEAEIPGQPPAAKVEYRIVIDDGAGTAFAPATGTAVARFRGNVPATALLPHILAMFLSMLVSTRALLEVVRPTAPAARTLVLVAMALLVIGGLLLGPIVQRFAFGALWTGWPFGHDLTDNKTLIAFIAWLPATFLAWRRLRMRAAVVLGWLVMTGVFLIPHSLRGSELDWTEIEGSPDAKITAAAR
jgi:hypothetical protein